MAEFNSICMQTPCQISLINPSLNDIVTWKLRALNKGTKGQNLRLGSHIRKRRVVF